MSKTALVTGACGFVGVNMLELLKAEGWKIVSTDLKGAKHKEYYCEKGVVAPVHYEDVIKEVGAKHIPADLTKKESLRPLFKRDYDAVFSVASLYDYFAPLDLLYKVNVEGHRNLVEAWLESGVKVKHWVHWATDGVYGETPYLPGDENCPYNPPNDYSRSKTEQEKMLWKFHEDERLPLTVLRPSPIYGPRHRYGIYHILYYLRKIGVGTTIRIYPRRKQLLFPSVHVKDMVRAALFVAERKDTIGEAYNVGSKCIGQDEFSEFLAHALGATPIYRTQAQWFMYKLVYKLNRRLIAWQHRRARKRGIRPKIDLPMIDYMTHQYWFSNEKLKRLGFKYVYEDPRKGLWEHIGWCKARGWL